MKKTLLVISFLLTQAFTQAAMAEIDAARQDELRYFVKHDCGSCHGMTMRGGLGPALLPDRLSAMPKSFLVSTILEGRPGTAMPGWKSMLTADEAAWITEQLQGGLMQPQQN